MPKELLERAGDWADRFLAEFGNYTAEETFDQTRWEGKRRSEVKRRIVSDYFIVRLPGSPRELQEFRDVVSVDDKEKLSDSARAVKWPKLMAATTAGEFEALVEDPQKYRMSPEHFGKLGLLVSRLAPRYQGKMKYFFAQDNSEVVSRTALVGYRQVSGEGLMEVDGKPVAPSGQAWVEPDDGHIVRIEEEFQHDKTHYSVAVDYAMADGLNAWVVETVTIRIFEKGRLVMQNIYGYSNFRRFAPAGGTPAP